ncbi:Glutathione S-transferase [Acetobacteraceae bacterium EV16G]|uniref:Glutathione S-transferase n=1 Tax=Sorlinia euscelidii TaxID=3081148 RepID=A0ABU7TZD0_9PROT
MRILYHLPLSPQSRLARLSLSERRIPFETRVENVWESGEDFLALNPAREVPVLVEEYGLAVPGGSVIAEYLEEAYTGATLLGHTLEERIETRRLLNWFDVKFHNEVSRNLLGEKVDKRISGRGTPDGTAIRAGYANLRFHLDYIGWLSETRAWLGGAQLTYADLAAAAHLSCLDFIGDIDWSRAPFAKDWYARVKSRPSFRALLHDKLPGFTPPPYYMDLDF